jgi:Pectate lyase superfamily protein
VPRYEDNIDLTSVGKVINQAVPVNPGDGASKGYVDTLVSSETTRAEGAENALQATLAGLAATPWVPNTAYAAEAIVTNGGALWQAPSGGAPSRTTFTSSDWVQLATIGAMAPVQSVAGRTGIVVLVESDITNLTFDLSAKAPLASPTFTGSPLSTTPTALDNSTRVATTAYTDSAVGVETIRAETAETTNASAISTEVTRATTAELALAPKASPTFTGIPVTPTAAALTNTTQIASTAYADSAVSVEKTRAQGAESTLTTSVTNETNRATNAESLLAPLASPHLTSVPTAPTATALTNNTQIATTAYTDAAVAARVVVTSFNSRTGAVSPASADYTAAQVTNAADKSSGSTQTFTAALSAPDFVPTGLVGATAVVRWAGGTTTGSPVSGTFAKGDYIITEDAHIFVCTTAGSPGTWADAGSWGSGSGAVASVFSRTGAVVANTGDYTAAQVTNAADKSSGSTQTFTGNISTPVVVASGITGATSATRYVGGTITGAPASGTFVAGDFVVAENGHIWVCNTSGSPGTWNDAGSVGNLVTSVLGRTGAVVATSGDYTAAQVTNAADKSSGSTQTFTGNLSAPAITASTGSATGVSVVASGMTGATSASRYVGATTTGAPVSGTFAVGDFIIAENGHLWICNTAGTPGTWNDAGSVGNLVTSVLGRTGAVVATSGDYTAAQVTNAADKSSASQQTFTGNVSAPAHLAAGLTGATAASRYVGATTSGVPATGTFLLGDFIIAENGHVFICTTAGSPGTWTDAGSSGNLVTSVLGRTGAVVATSGDYTAAQVTNAADTSSGSQQTFTGNISSPALIAAGLTGATSVSRYVGATTSGAPASGTFVVGDFIIAENGHVWICTTAGSPGTWTDAGSSANLVTSVFSRTGAVVATSGDYTAAQVTNSADKSSGSQQTFTGNVSTPALIAAGLTGATSATRYVGATASGAPASGTFVVGDFIIDQTGKIWICTTAGSPGTWTQTGAVASFNSRTGAVVPASGDYTAAQVTNAADKSSGSTQTFTGALAAPDFAPSGLTGATSAVRFVGGTTTGAPASGTFAKGDFVITEDGHIFVCTTAGTSGTWVDAGSQGTYTAAQITNAADKSSASQQTFTGNVSAPAVISAGLTGATQASRYVGSTTSGAPASGTFVVGDFIIAHNGHIFVCTSAGTPGTWTDAGSVGNLVTSVLGRTGVVVATSGDYTAAQVTNAADKSSGSTQTFTGNVSSPALIASGLTGAIQASRYVGATNTGAPTTGTFSIGDFIIAGNGHIFICTSAGSPGTWTDVAASAAVTSFNSRTGAIAPTTGDYTAAQVAAFPVFNVKSSTYGATGNGSTDDTTALQSAITAAASAGGVVYLPPGTYVISVPLTVTGNGVSIWGAGPGATTIHIANSFTGTGAIIVTGAADFQAANFGFNSTSTTTYSSNPFALGIQVNHSSRAIITNILGTALNGYTVEIVSDATGDSYYPILTGVHAVAGKDGIHLLGTASSDHNMGAFITNCTVEQLQNGDGLLIEDVFDCAVNGLEGGVSAGTGSVVHIRGIGGAHYLSNMDIGATISGAPATGPTVLIDASGSGSPYAVAISNSIIEYGTPCVSVAAGSDIVFHGCHFVGGGINGFLSSGACNRVSITGCYFDQNGYVAGANHFDFNWGSSGEVLLTGNYFCTNGGSGAQQVTSACAVSAGTTRFINNIFDGATPFLSTFPTLARNNSGYNPIGAIGPPSIPSSTTAFPSPYGSDAMVYITAGSSTCAVAISGTSVLTIPSAGVGTVRVPVTESITLTYSNAPTWKWMGD